MVHLLRKSVNMSKCIPCLFGLDSFWLILWILLHVKNLIESFQIPNLDVLGTQYFEQFFVNSVEFLVPVNSQKWTIGQSSRVKTQPLNFKFTQKKLNKERSIK